MRFKLRRALFGALVVGVVAACGSAVTPTGSSTAAPTGTGAATSSPGASASANQSTASASAPAASATSAGHGGANVLDPCALATAGEVSSALGVVVEVEAITGDTTTYCNYNAADGSLVMATSFSRGETFVFDSHASSEGAVVVPGIGDGAVVTTDGVLFIKSGDAVVGLQPGEEFNSPAELISALTPLAQAVASRL